MGSVAARAAWRQMHGFTHGAVEPCLTPCNFVAGRPRAPYGEPGDALGDPD
jgi:hypothetical protein